MALERSNDISPPKLKYFLRQTVCLFNGPQRVEVLKVNITEKPGSPHIYGIADMNNVEEAPLVTMLAIFASSARKCWIIWALTLAEYYLLSVIAFRVVLTWFQMRL